MYSNKTREEAISLLDTSVHSSEEEFDKLEGVSHGMSTSGRLRTSLVSRLGGWIPAAVLSFIVLDIALFIYTARLLLATCDVAFGTLEVRNTYVGLDELYATGHVNASEHPPILNRPRVVTQVTSSNPNKVFPIDQLRGMTSTGTMSPPDSHLHVSGDTHTIAQFRVLDWGMERCQLAIRLPALSASLPHPFVFQGDPSAGVQLEICELDADKKLYLDATKISWNTKAKCVKHVGTVVARPDNEVKLPEFPCKWGVQHTFEISCSDREKCMIDVRPTQVDPWGVFMYQYQTV